SRSAPPAWAAAAQLWRALPVYWLLGGHQTVAFAGRIFVKHNSGSSSSIELAHEQIRPEAVRLSSNRSFGASIGAILALAGIAPLLKSRPANGIVLGAAVVVFALAFAYPEALAPFHKIWFRVALGLHSVMSPILMAVLFFGLLAPLGYLMRAFGRDPLELSLSRKDPGASYWHAREASLAASMKVPF